MLCSGTRYCSRSSASHNSRCATNIANTTSNLLNSPPSAPHRPSVDLTRIHRPSDLLGLVLAFHISFALSARKTTRRSSLIYRAAYTTVLNEFGLSADLVVEGNETVEGGAAAARLLVERPIIPTGVICQQESMNCHSERNEESCSVPGGSPQEGQGEIPRFARNDSASQSRLRFLALRLRATRRRDFAYGSKRKNECHDLPRLHRQSQRAGFF